MEVFLFIKEREVKDLLSYFRVVINPRDEETKRTINYPSRGIGSTTIQKLIIAANENDCSIWDIINKIDSFNIKINSGTKNKLSQYSTLINSFSAQSETKDAYELTEIITKSCGLFRYSILIKHLKE